MNFKEAKEKFMSGISITVITFFLQADTEIR